MEGNHDAVWLGMNAAVLGVFWLLMKLTKPKGPSRRP